MVVIDTDCGKLFGLEDEKSQTFLGIPYSKPPIGKFRFMPPEDCESWGDIRDCTKYGAAAPQLYVKELTVLRDGETLGEDCLYLNVFTPKQMTKKGLC